MSYAHVPPSAALPTQGGQQRHFEPVSAVRSIFTPLFSPRSILQQQQASRESVIRLEEGEQGIEEEGGGQDAQAKRSSAFFAPTPPTPSTAGSRRNKARPISMGWDVTPASAFQPIDSAAVNSQSGIEIFSMHELLEHPSVEDDEHPENKTPRSASAAADRMASIELSPGTVRQSDKRAEEDLSEDEEDTALIYRSENDPEVVGNGFAGKKRKMDSPHLNGHAGPSTPPATGATTLLRANEHSSLLGNEDGRTALVAIQFEPILPGEASWMWISMAVVSGLALVSLLISYDVIDWPGDGLGKV